MRKSNTMNNSIKNRNRKFLFLTGFVILTLFAVYSALWFYFASLIRENITRNIEKLAEKNIIIDPVNYYVKGYPLEHIVVFEGKINDGFVTIDIPRLSSKGFLLPGRFVEISALDGVERFTNEIQNNSSLKIDEIRFELRIPDRIPSYFNKKEMSKWQEEENYILFRNIYAMITNMKLSGEGSIALDENLQPKALFNLKITDHELLLIKLKNEAIITEDAFKMFSLATRFISKIDEQTGKTYIDLPLILNKSILNIGPASLGHVGTIYWENQ